MKTSTDLPTLDSLAVVRLVLVQLARRGVIPSASKYGMAKACEAAGRLLRALEVEDTADPLGASVVDFDLYRSRLDRKAVRHA